MLIIYYREVDEADQPTSPQNVQQGSLVAQGYFHGGQSSTSQQHQNIQPIMSGYPGPGIVRTQGAVGGISAQTQQPTQPAFVQPTCHGQTSNLPAWTPSTGFRFTPAVTLPSLQPTSQSKG